MNDIRHSSAGSSEPSDPALLPDGRRPTGFLVATTLFLVLLCIALLVIDSFLAAKSRKAELQQADIATTNLARSVAAQTNSMVSEVEHILDLTVYELERREITEDTLLSLQPLLVTQAANVKQIQDLFVYGPDGHLRASSDPVVDGGVDDRHREYFTFHQSNPSRRMHIGVPIETRTAGSWVIPLSRRFEDADGRFSGVALATIEVDHVLRLMERFEIGQKGSIGIYRDSSELLARRPYSEKDLGRSFAGTGLHKEISTNRSGRTSMQSPVDQVVRRISYEQVEDQPLKVTVSVSEDEVLAKWRDATRAQTGIILVLCVVIAVGGGFLLRAIRHRGKVEAHLYQTRYELGRANTRLEHSARHDSLTNLPNRRYFDEYLERAMVRAVRTKGPMAVIALDVDFFKQYNDRYGHPAGDRCLCAVAAAMASVACRPDDIAARYGGEEFMVLLPDTDLAGALNVAEAMREAVFGLDIEHEGNLLQRRVTVSLGVAAQCIDSTASSASELLHHADTALYEAKRQGRNRVVGHGIG